MKGINFCLVILSIIICCFECGPLLTENNQQLNGSKVIYKYLTSEKSCFFKGVRYMSGQIIVRRNPCHTCVCVKGSVECFWQSCPPPPEGCSVIPYQGVCNPSIYECPIPLSNSTFYVKSRRGQRSGSGVVRADCVIRNIAYLTGETIGVASHNCLECRCAKNSMYCTPLCCFQRANVEEDSAFKYRTIDSLKRRVDPNPLAHLYEELGLPPSGSL